MHTVRVELGERYYPIHVGDGTRAMLQNCNISAGAPAPLVVITDATVARLHLQRLRPHLPVEPTLLTFPPGENSKSLDVVRGLFDRMAAVRADRDTLVITFGGGVAGDLGGFVAATWMRGVRYIQVPTTLLAAVDASVGGKTGVNLSAGKNLVGAFHQPAMVVIDTDFLATLADRDFRAGLAESVKHATIRDPAYLAWHEQHAEAILARDPVVLTEMIARDCAIKADVVSRDERESGLRAILNHGHTIGHALEHLLQYELRHGECVALGMLVENEIAVRRATLPRSDADRIRTDLVRLGLPTRLPRPVAVEHVLEACRIDKKARSGRTHFILLASIGDPRHVTDVDDDEIRQSLGCLIS